MGANNNMDRSIHRDIFTERAKAHLPNEESVLTQLNERDIQLLLQDCAVRESDISCQVKVTEAQLDGILSANNRVKALKATLIPTHPPAIPAKPASPEPPDIPETSNILARDLESAFGPSDSDINNKITHAHNQALENYILRIYTGSNAKPIADALTTMRDTNVIPAHILGSLIVAKRYAENHGHCIPTQTLQRITEEDLEKRLEELKNEPTAPAQAAKHANQESRSIITQEIAM